jgi:hypothetical protein
MGFVGIPSTVQNMLLQAGLWTVKICCGSGSNFEKVLVPDPDPDNIYQFSKYKKIAQNHAFLCQKQHVSSGTTLHSGSGFSKVKSFGSCGSGSQYWP